jgi:uncharacterized protein YjbJ (UPF0337 family)
LHRSSPSSIGSAEAATGLLQTSRNTCYIKEAPAMATRDKAKNTAQRVKGKVKEAAGEVTGNDDLRHEGRADQTKGNLKQAGEKLRDAIKR